MCAPALGAVVGIVGSVVSGIGAAQQANAQAQQAEQNAKVEKINARSARFEGQAANEQAEFKQEAQRGEIVAAAGKNNVDPFFGSAMAILTEANRAQTADDNNRYLAAESKATGHENKAKDLEAQAANYRQAGKIGMASSFLSGIGGAAKSLSSAGGGGSSALFLNG